MYEYEEPVVLTIGENETESDDICSIPYCVITGAYYIICGINCTNAPYCQNIHCSSGGGAFGDYLESDEYMDYPEIFGMFEDWNGRHTTQITYEFNNPDVGCPYNANADDIRCGLRIALDGNVFPCQSFTDDKFIIGNVYSQTLAEILNGELLSAFISAIHARKGNIEQCKPCGYKALCSGGCPAAAYIENGTLNSVSARCKSRKQSFNATLLHMLREAARNRSAVDG